MPHNSYAFIMNNRNNQNGFGHIFIILIVIVVAMVGFAGYRVLTKSKSSSNKSSGEYSKFTSLDDCLAQYSKQGEDPSKANDTCISLKNANANSNYKAAVEDTTKNATNSTCTPEPALADAKGAFKELPFDTSNIRIVTLGKETNDARFVYPWVKSGSVKIYAPADGVLYKIRHKVFVEGGKNGNDYDIFFQVDCGTVYRLNHITDPRADIKATYPAGDLASGDYANGGLDIPERVVPLKAIKVKAGESLGSTSGTPTAHDFDFAVGVAAEAPKSGELMSVCPFSVFVEPQKTTLMNLLGPKNGTPTPGFACDVPSQKF